MCLVTFVNRWLVADVNLAIVSDVYLVLCKSGFYDNN